MNKIGQNGVLGIEWPIWVRLTSNLVPKLMNTCIPNPLGIMVPDSTEGSDLSTSIAVLKKKLRVVLLNTQKIYPLSSILGWSTSNEW